MTTLKARTRGIDRWCAGGARRGGFVIVQRGNARPFGQIKADRLDDAGVALTAASVSNGRFLTVGF